MPGLERIGADGLLHRIVRLEVELRALVAVGGHAQDALAAAIAAGNGPRHVVHVRARGDDVAPAAADDRPTSSSRAGTASDCRRFFAPHQKRWISMSLVPSAFSFSDVIMVPPVVALGRHFLGIGHGEAAAHDLLRPRAILVAADQVRRSSVPPAPVIGFLTTSLGYALPWNVAAGRRVTSM